MEGGENSQIQAPKMGYSFFIYPKLHTGTDAYNGLSYGFMYRLRNYNLENGNTVLYKDYTFMVGYDFTLWKYVVLEASYGMGFRKADISTRTENKDMDLEFIFPIQVKIAYIF